MIIIDWITIDWARMQESEHWEINYMLSQLQLKPLFFSAMVTYEVCMMMYMVPNKLNSIYIHIYYMWLPWKYIHVYKIYFELKKKVEVFYFLSSYSNSLNLYI